MSGAVKAVTVIDVLFLLLLSIAGFFRGNGVLYGFLYVLAFAIPVLVGLLLLYPKIRRQREEERGLVEPLGSYISLTCRGTLDFLPLVFPTVALVFAVSFITSLLLGIFGFSSVQDYSGVSFGQMLIQNALVPAVLEELLFRFIPLLILRPYGNRACVLLSALYFSMLHANLFSMPYAFAAGVLFMAIDIACDSILPSLILHFVNNAVSVVWMKFCTPDDPLGISIFLSVLLGLTFLSAAVILVKRKVYGELLKKSFEKGRRIETSAPFIIVAIGVLSSVMSLMTQVK